MPGANRNYTSDRFSLDLDGIRCGFIESVEGGNVSAEVISESVSPDYFVKKHIGQPKHEDFSLRIGLSMEKKVYEWIAASWKGNHQRKDGSVIIADAKGHVKAEKDFFNALVTETTIPAMDASSKDAAYMTLKFSPEFTRSRKKASGKVNDNLEKGKRGQKKWLPANFRLEIDGLDCTRINKVDSFTVNQATVSEDIGVARDQIRAGKLEFPNLRITLQEFTAQSWFDWHEDFVIKGNCGDDKEKNGALTFLAPTLKTELARVDFYHLGIFRISAGNPEPQVSRIPQVVAELYCERMEFVYYL